MEISQHCTTQQDSENKLVLLKPKMSLVLISGDSGTRAEPELRNQGRL